MDRLDGTLGETIRLFQATIAPTITIRNPTGVKVVNNAPTTPAGTSNLVYYDFTPPGLGTFLIKWEGAVLQDRWEIIDVKPDSLSWLVNRIKDKTDELPSAISG